MMPKYLFVHIPKTAGVKIRHNIHMNANYPHTKMCVQEEGCDLRLLTDAELQQFDVVSGHFGFAVRRRLEPTRRCITILRNPLDRVISTYFYWKTLKGTVLAQLANAVSIYDFVVSEDPTIIEYVDNAQAWQIFWDFLSPSRKQFSNRPRAELLAAAKKNLESFDFVGIQEDMPATLGKLKRSFSWQWTDDAAEKINKTADYQASDIDFALLRQRLGDRLALDDELYAYGLSLFKTL